MRETIAKCRIRGMSFAAVLVLGVVGLATGCLGPSSASTPTSAATPTLDPALAELRTLGLAYWDTYNSYDLDTLLAYLEPSYRDEQEDLLRNKIQLLKAFHVKLGVSVAEEPKLTGPQEAEMYVLIREPLGNRRTLMRFRKMDRWMITYAQEVKGGE